MTDSILSARYKFMALAHKQAQAKKITYIKKPKVAKYDKNPNRPKQQPIPDGYASHKQIAAMFGVSFSAVTQAVSRGYLKSKPWGKYAIILITDYEIYRANIAIHRKESAARATKARLAKAKERRDAKSQ